MALRKIIHIDEEKCDGCGLCVPSCAEGAISIINGKAKIIADKYCDGLGACLGECPKDALKIIEREADEFDEEAVHQLLANQKQNNKAEDCGCSGGNMEQKSPTTGHHGHQGHQGGGCPGSRMMNFDNKKVETSTKSYSSDDIEFTIKPQLQQWPVQLMLVPEDAPYFKNSDLLVTADCVAVAYPNYHIDLLKGRRVVMACPKLDDIQHYVTKLTQMVRKNDFKSITVAYMEVPCCMGIVKAVDAAVEQAGVEVKVNKVKIGVHGDKK